jgi:hypothetical protein
MSKYIALLLAASALAGCCLSPNGCYPPVAGAPIAWDGLGSPPAEMSESAAAQPEDAPKHPSQPKKKIAAGQAGASAAEPKRKLEGRDAYIQQEAEDRAAEEKLTRKLTICSNCLPARTQNDASANR